MYSEIEENPASFLQSDTEIYNTLLDAKKAGHPLLKFFQIMYPNKVPVEPINAIYVGRLTSDDNKKMTTNESTEWEVTTNIYIITKKYDHLERYKMLKLATYSVMEVLSKSRIADFLDFPHQQFIYDNHNIIQTSKIEVTSYETAHRRKKINDEIMKVCSVLSEIEIVD